jgi:hypothetical protein
VGRFKPWCNLSKRLFVQFLIVFNSCNEGTTPEGAFLDNFLGEAYDAEFLPPFDRFLGAVYGNSSLWDFQMLVIDKYNRQEDLRFASLVIASKYPWPSG